jgi:selT/selW/selH-like putative selenoprotein
MKRNFMELARVLEGHYPSLIGNVVGELYPPSDMAVLLNNITTILWLGGSLLLFFGMPVLKFLQVPDAAINYVETNKMMFFVGLFFLNNMASGLMKSGAFEVYLNDELVYSKIDVGRMPSLQDITRALDERGVN